MLQGRSACGCIERTMKAKVRRLSQAGSLGNEPKREQLLIFSGVFGRRAYNSIVVLASPWQILNP